MSFSLYRVLHQTHHAFIFATERDYEFWPLSQTTTPRWKRCLAAIFRAESRIALFAISIPASLPSLSFSGPKQRLRRRIWAELALTVVTWTLILWQSQYWPLRYFIWMYLPRRAVLAG